MPLLVNVPDDVARRLRAAAAANGVSVDEFVTALVVKSVPESPTPRNADTSHSSESATASTARVTASRRCSMTASECLS
jgi:plasmid stability protein